jgi:hypothetical protein
MHIFISYLFSLVCFYFQNGGNIRDGVFQIFYAFFPQFLTIEFAILEYDLLNIYKQIMEAKF